MAQIKEMPPFKCLLLNALPRHGYFYEPLYFVLFAKDDEILMLNSVRQHAF